MEQREDNLKSDSLFSLEVVVDTLKLKDNVVCRYPAIAFRLLDYPTLLIYHVEPNLGEQIHSKINADPYYKLPPQLPELQDKNGRFVVKKGKSCLFKISPDLLHGYLQATPLYVMLIDTFPEVPKLLASCTVPLDACMDKIYEDITRMGLSVPSVHGEKGDQDLYDMMGRTVGGVEIGFRLLSLGVGLLQHIPDHSVARMKSRGSVKVPAPAKSATETEHGPTDVVLYDLETTDKPVQVAIEPQPKHSENTLTQTPLLERSIAATQTERGLTKKPTRRIQIDTAAIRNEVDDYFVTNSVCPPPLFYNSEMEVPDSRDLLLSHYPLGLPPPDKNDGFDSEEDSIRDEDKFSESDDDKFSEKIFKPRKAKVTSVQSTSSPQKAPPNQIQGNISQLPILNALLHEILCLQGSQSSLLQQDAGKIMKKIIPARPLSPARNKTAEATPRPLSPGRKQFVFPKESQSQASTRLASPKRVPPGKLEARPTSPGGPEARPTSPGGVHKHSCQREEPIAPKTRDLHKNQGWLRHQVHTGVMKTKFNAGMTNTQRLRLAKTNPQLLASLEKEEEVRLRKRREMMYKKWGSQNLLSSTVIGDVSTEISHHPLKDTDIPKLDLSDVGKKHHKKPVPTPRHSFGTREIDGIIPHDEVRSQPPKRRPRRGQTKQVIPEKGADLVDDGEPQSSRIEVHLPLAEAHNDSYEIGATSVNDSELESPRPAKRNLNNTKTLNNPGFPALSQDTLAYSDDFDSSSLNTSKLRRILDRHSDFTDEEHQQTTLDGISAGDELGLRCIVDRYSDDEKESRDPDKGESEKSDYSRQSSNHSVEVQNGRNKKLSLTDLPKPASSVFSPDTMNDSHASRQPPLATRQPFIAVSENMSNTQESTAFLSRSEVTSHASHANDVIGQPKSTGPIHPKPIPRTPRTPRNISVRTDSISSYAPSEGDIIPLETPEKDTNYSDSFEDYSEDDTSEIVKIKQMSELKIDPKAKLGYTWGY